MLSAWGETMTTSCEECGRLFWPTSERGDRWCSVGCAEQASGRLWWLDGVLRLLAVGLSGLAMFLLLRALGRLLGLWS